MADEKAPKNIVTQVHALLCAEVFCQVKTRAQKHSGALHSIMCDLLKQHAAAFVNGEHPYKDGEHPLIDELREKYIFDADELMKNSVGKAILSKGQACNRDIRNVILPEVYKCSDTLHQT